MSEAGTELRLMKNNKPSKYRSFNGKRYEVYDLCLSKNEAREEATSLRQEGYYARVLSTKYGTYLVYRCKRN